MLSNPMNRRHAFWLLTSVLVAITAIAPAAAEPLDARIPPLPVYLEVVSWWVEGGEAIRPKIIMEHLVKKEVYPVSTKLRTEIHFELRANKVGEIAW
jgi:hypothetical protein